MDQEHLDILMFLVSGRGKKRLCRLYGMDGTLVPVLVLIDVCVFFSLIKAKHLPGASLCGIKRRPLASDATKHKLTGRAEKKLVQPASDGISFKVAPVPPGGGASDGLMWAQPVLTPREREKPPRRGPLLSAGASPHIYFKGPHTRGQLNVNPSP